MIAVLPSMATGLTNIVVGVDSLRQQPRLLSYARIEYINRPLV